MYEGDVHSCRSWLDRTTQEGNENLRLINNKNKIFKKKKKTISDESNV